MSDLTTTEIETLADRLTVAASERLAPQDRGYWAPTETQTNQAITAVLLVLQQDANAHGVQVDFGPLMAELGRRQGCA